ncbi:hypothetical protein [Empedobacter falsenii]|uniref:Uncharacterized protein n=1 Tax=Empedobacter falsenii TaxID=343874 RepID=A0A376FYA8_9FLAO|nr:hypothetical protein [Empedobacter falsenii]STD53054.1 Uncharacterised protein [Empedobacter falsenii]
MSRYFTENCKEVTDRVKNGLLIIFSTRLEAEKDARDKKSYSYQVFNLERQHVGWGVPK